MKRIEMRFLPDVSVPYERCADGRLVAQGPPEKLARTRRRNETT